MQITEKQKHELKKFIKELERHKGRHTELVSVYIPQGYDIVKIINHLDQEKGTATNIKSAATRKNVIDSLERMTQHLRLYKKTPENGLAVFSGNVAEREGQQDFKVWSIEPPIPLKTRIYRCDKEFVLELLRDMLEIKEVYGLVIVDRRDANIAYLKGKTIIPILKTHSEVPGKTRAGGQCLVKGSLIQMSDGSLSKIELVHNPHKVKSMIINNSSIRNSNILDKWNVKKSLIYKIVTKNPRLVVESSKDHMFFAVTNNGIIEKAAEDLKIGDLLIMPEKISIKGEMQHINSLKYYNSFRNITLPDKIDETFAQFIGYFMGDGCIENDRITFFEQNKGVALSYKNKFEKYFGIDISYRFRESKNYHQLRITSRSLVRLIRDEFPETKKALNSEIPDKILKSKDNVVASFLSGMFDAEGYSSENHGVGIGINNKLLAKQLQMLLLRYSIISSFLEYDNRRNPYSKNVRYTLEFSERKSLELFKKKIGFTSLEKIKKLDRIIEKKSNTSFKNSILANIRDKTLYKRLKEIYYLPILPVKISKINVIEKVADMIDISIKDQNFIANGIFVHNSAARFERLREGAKIEHFKKVAEYMKEKFLGDKNLKGIIVGGPGPTKYDFIDTGYITTEVKNKIIAIKDLSYTGDFGLKELVEKSEDVLAKEGIIEEKKIMAKFFEILSTKPGMVSYGIDETMKNLKLGAADTLLVSEELDDKKMEEFEKEASQVGTNVRIISTETSEGVQLRDLGKAAAILRYEVNR